MTRIFDSSLEIGVRLVALMSLLHPRSIDLQRLVVLDYLTLHSGDADGPESLHLPVPMRSGELVVRRELIEDGLRLMMTRGLVDRLASAEGFTYVASELAGTFLSMLGSPYSQRLLEKASWVAQSFGDASQEDLRVIERKFFQAWTTSFQKTRQSLDKNNE